MARSASILMSCTLFVLSAFACSTAVNESHALVGVRVDRVVLDEHDAPVVVLEEEEGSRWLPIWIGSAEARSIALQIEQHPSPRPNSHDLAQRLIEQLDGEVVRVVVTDLESGIYYAVLSLRQHGETVDVDSRPSDAIAIALRTGAPIFIRESLFDRSADSMQEPPASVDDPGRPI